MLGSLFPFGSSFQLGIYYATPPSIHRLVELASASHHIFKFFIYNERKTKTKIAPVNYLECHWSLEPKDLALMSCKNFTVVKTAPNVRALKTSDIQKN